VAAVDGCHFGMHNPGMAVPDSRAYYVLRKSCYALLATAVCDAELRFLFWDFNVTPTTHDSQAWALSELGLMIHKLPPPYFICGDSAYIPSEQMVTPYGKPEMTNYDFVQSSNRICIERAFGVLIRRWGILWRDLTMRFDKRAKVVGCCMRLHNYCVDSRVALDGLAVCGGSEACAVPGDGVVNDRWECTPVFDRDGRPVKSLTDLTALAPAAAAAGEASNRRAELAVAVAEVGFVRPPPDRGPRRGR